MTERWPPLPPVAAVSTLGSHLVADFHGCRRRDLLDRPAALVALMEEAARRAGATVVGQVVHRFEPHGVTAVLVLAESHLSLHTWPEHGFVAMDLYTCGQTRPELACAVVEEALGPTRVDARVLRRGSPVDPTG